MRKVHRTEIKCYCIKKSNNVNKMKMWEPSKDLSSEWKNRWFQNLGRRWTIVELIFSVNFLSPRGKKGNSTQIDHDRFLQNIFQSIVFFHLTSPRQITCAGEWLINVTSYHQQSEQKLYYQQWHDGEYRDMKKF